MKTILLTLLISLCTMRTEAQALLAYYPFNGNANDAAGTLNGTVSGAVLSSDKNNNASSAYSFNGTNQYINLGSSAVIRPTAALSVSLWFELNITGTLSGRSMFSCTENAGYNIHYRTGNLIECNVFRNGSYATISTSATPYNNTGWHFAVMTYDGRYTRFYLDGNLVGSNDAGANYPITYVTNNTYIGAEPSGTSGIDANWYYQGKLDDIKIYNGALSNSEVLAEYLQNKPIPNVGLKLWLRADSGLVLNGASVSQWTDISGNNLNAVQDSANKRPNVVSDAINGKPAVHFDGSNDLLYTQALNLENTNKVSAFMVSKATGEAVILEASRNLNTSATGFYVIENYDYGQQGISAALKGNTAGPYNNYLTIFRSTNTYSIPKIWFTAFDKSQASYLNQIKMRVNGVDLVNTNGYGAAHTNNFSNDSLFIGGRGAGGSNLDGDIAEVIVYNRLLTTAERTQVENYLNQRYNVSSTLAQYKPGSGNALHFDGTNDYVSVPALSSTVSNFTLSYWIKNTGTDASFDRITSTSSDAFETAKDANGTIKYFINGGWHSGFASIGTNTWVHIAFVRSGNNLKVYRNGIQVLSTSITTTALPVNWWIGRRANNVEFANMALDEFKLYRVALSENQIRKDMCRKILAQDTLFEHLLVYYNFDEETGTTAYDASINGRHGNIQNGPVHTRSGVPLGNSSAFNYASGNFQASLTGSNAAESLTAFLSGGTANGLHVYHVNEQPALQTGISNRQANSYYGVFSVNGNSPVVNVRYNYAPSSLSVPENTLHLYQRLGNDDSTWVDAMAVLNTDSNFLSVNSQETEFIPGSLNTLSTSFRDLDGDGYGNPADSIVDYSIPQGYVISNTDCNDNDAMEYPGQVWYGDADGDGYGNGLSMTQCQRPAYMYAASELSATSGDCNDNDSTIYPGYQHFEYTGQGAFTTKVISPDNGDSYTNFQFEVVYSDASGAFPPPSYPRVLLDFEGNGIYNNTNDRVIFLAEDDVNDQNTVDGKKYIGSINGLPVGTNWKTLVQTTSLPCGSAFGPFDYPDVLIRPDLEIFANDITFSTPNPPVSSPLTLSAVIHNVSDYPAQNFVVHLTDQYDPALVFPDMTVTNLAPHSATTVTWNLTTIATPSWHPMQVIVDYTNVIDESNELDNSALRPYINGNYNLPGSINSTAYCSPSISYQSAGYINLSGFSYYSGTAVPLADSSVAGATVTFTIVETGASFTTHTNSNGQYSYNFPKPLPVGIYHITGTCTDFTLTGTLNAQFEIIAPVYTSCNLPELTVRINVPTPTIVAGSSLVGTIQVKNSGNTTSAPTQLNLSQTGGIPILASPQSIPAIAPDSIIYIPFNILFSTTGQYNLCAYTDAMYEVQECDENNNSTCQTINVLPALPDIVPIYGTEGQGYQCNITHAGFSLYNFGGVATGPFNCRVITKYMGTTINTFNQLIANILPVQSGNNHTSFLMPFVPVFTGAYTFEVYADYPLNEVTELSETNNNATYLFNVIQCKPDFTISSCEYMNVTSADGNYTPGTNVTLYGKINNSGNLAYFGNLVVRFSITPGTTYDTTLSVNLPPGTDIVVTKTVPAPPYATSDLTITADPDNLINEFSEANNDRSGSMCWDFQPVPFCTHNFWDDIYLVNQTINLSIGIKSFDLYDADTVKVKFQVSGPGITGSIDLGDAVAYNVKQTCNCPVGTELPISFGFMQTGTYTFTMTIDPYNEYAECNENNNVLTRTVTVNSLPDMRVLSQFIAPSKLNPDPNESITMNVTYENIGASNINEQMKLRVIVDNTPLDSIYPLSGLVHNGNATVAIPQSWSSNLIGVHVIRAIIDDDNQVTETNELNNEATRAVVVGESANLYFKHLIADNYYPELNTPIQISTLVGNSGDLACQSDVEFYYVDDNMDSLLIATQHVNVAAHDSEAFTIPWTVLDNRTTIVAKIVNSSILEYTYDDNKAELRIGDLAMVLYSEPACDSSQNQGFTGTLKAEAFGGTPPYLFNWSNGWTLQELIAGPGTYSVTVTDITGQTVQQVGTIAPCPSVYLTLRLFLQGYYNGNHLMRTVLKNQGVYAWKSAVDSVEVELRKDSLGYPLLANSKGIVMQDGTLKVYFSNNSLVGSNGYIVVRHRNSVTTWSANPVSIAPVMSYTFYDAANKAYGNNLAEISDPAGNVFAVYTGEINQDDNIDLVDNILVENSTNNFEIGYLGTDLNGDGNADLLDNPILDDNIISFIFSQHP